MRKASESHVYLLRKSLHLLFVSSVIMCKSIPSDVPIVILLIVFGWRRAYVTSIAHFSRCFFWAPRLGEAQLQCFGWRLNWDWTEFLPRIDSGLHHDVTHSSQSALLSDKKKKSITGRQACSLQNTSTGLSVMLFMFIASSLRSEALAENDQGSTDGEGVTHLNAKCHSESIYLRCAIYLLKAMKRAMAFKSGAKESVGH